MESKGSAGRLIVDTIQNTCGGAQITPIQRRYFNDAQGIDLIHRYNAEECSNVDASVFLK